MLLTILDQYLKKFLTDKHTLSKDNLSAPNFSFQCVEEAKFYLCLLWDFFLAGPENETDTEAVSQMYMFYITQKSL